jgi:hypothetical protein
MKSVVRRDEDQSCFCEERAALDDAMAAERADRG